MTEWLVEEGIGEERAILVDGHGIVAARIRWPGTLACGQVIDARLVSRRAGTPRGTARTESGQEILVSRLPHHASEGAIIRLEVSREGMPESGRTKLAQAIPTNKPLEDGAGLADQLQRQGAAVHRVRHFPEPHQWDELWQDAWDRQIGFSSGTLLFHLTPAMTLIDIDGDDDPQVLAGAAVRPLAAALRRFDLGGSIGVDFPTISNKSGRKAIDAMLETALAGWPHERTAMNGFGFVQLVARSERPSILVLLAHHPAAATARHLLRTAERLQGAGVIELTCPEGVASVLRPEWLQELTRRTGRLVRLQVRDQALDLPGVHAQLVPHE